MAGRASVAGCEAVACAGGSSWKRLNTAVVRPAIVKLPLAESNFVLRVSSSLELLLDRVQSQVLAYKGGIAEGNLVGARIEEHHDLLVDWVDIFDIV